MMLFCGKLCPLKNKKYPVLGIFKKGGSCTFDQGD